MIGNYDRWPLEADDHLDGDFCPARSGVLLDFSLSLLMAFGGVFLVAVLIAG